MAVRSLTFKVLWDEEAKVFYTECDEVCGIVAEAGTIEKLRGNLLNIIPHVLEFNDTIAVKKLFQFLCNLIRFYNSRLVEALADYKFESAIQK